MILFLAGCAAGFVVSVVGYEIALVGPIIREIEKARRDFAALRPHVSATPVRSDLTDSTPSLPL
ncbi:MAG: hypothetical protein EBR82_46495 [Caulobacteraceae bacterium]|nr:hypothetical protein [Caulobacteraceae bacterium]